MSPSNSPTNVPTTQPSRDPTQSPSTPAPLPPGSLICGDHLNYNYNDEALNLLVRMSFYGDMTLDASNSTFAITKFEAPNLGTDDDHDGILTLYDVQGGHDYAVTLEAADGTYGDVVLDIKCTSDSPTLSPTEYPTTGPTRDPTIDPTRDPTSDPTHDPTSDPTKDPTALPTVIPTHVPTASPTSDPTSDPTTVPTVHPTADPTVSPTINPTVHPTTDPTAAPSTDPSTAPTSDPTTSPTAFPSVNPTADPTAPPSANPTADPTLGPTTYPSYGPTANPTVNPSVTPTAVPTESPTKMPTAIPSAFPSSQPTTGYPTAADLMVQNYSLHLTASYDDMELYLFKTSSTKEAFAIDIVTQALQVEEYGILSQVEIIINDVREGSIIIDYALEYISSEILDLGLDNIQNSWGTELDFVIDAGHEFEVIIGTNTLITPTPTTQPTLRPTVAPSVIVQEVVVVQESSSTTLIIGIVAAVVVILAVIGGVVVFKKKGSNKPHSKKETSRIESVDETKDSCSSSSKSHEEGRGRGHTEGDTTYKNILVKQLLNNPTETESSKSDITLPPSPPNADRNRAMELGVTSSVANVMLELVDMNICGKLEEQEKARNNGNNLPSGILKVTCNMLLCEPVVIFSKIF